MSEHPATRARTEDEAREGALLVYGAGRNQLPVLEAGRRAGWRLVAVDRDPQAPGAALADRFLNVSLRDHRAIVAQTAGEDLRGVVARITDREGLESSCRLAWERGLAAPCPELFAAATSKLALADLCRRSGLPTPERLTAPGPADFAAGPWIVRPDVSIRGKAGISRVTSSEALAARVEEAQAVSGNGRVDVSRWIDGLDVSALVRLDGGRAERLALWDEWVAVDETGRIRGLGCATPSRLAGRTAAIDALQDALARSLPESRCLIALSLRIDEAGRPWIIEIHLGIGGDGIADQLLPAAIGDYDAFAAWIGAQTGEPPARPTAAARPSALLRDGSGWRLVEAGDVASLHARCRETLPEGWEAPGGLLPCGAR